MLGRWVLAIAIALCSTGSASANQRFDRYVSVYLGTSVTDPSDLLIVQPAMGTRVTFHDVSWRGEPFEEPPFYGLRIGGFSRIHPHWGVEFDLTHFKVLANTDRLKRVSGTWHGSTIDEVAPMATRVDKFNITHGVNLVGVHLLYRWMLKASPRYPDGRIQPFVGAGPDLTIVHPENAVEFRDNDQKYRMSGVSWELVTGLRYRIAPKYGIVLIGKYTETHASVNVADGRASTHLSTWHTAAGVEYAF